MPGTDERPDRAARWYDEGLRFACTGCGRCCTGGGGYVWVGVEEIRRLAARTGMGLDDFGRRFLRRVGARYALVDGPRGACTFLRGASCAVYDDRPAQCRAFPWWPANLESPAAWKQAAKSCEGISDLAPVVVVEAIEASLAEARAAGLTSGFSEEDDGEGRPPGDE